MYLEPERSIFKYLLVLYSQELPLEIHLNCDWLHPRTAPKGWPSSAWLSWCAESKLYSLSRQSKASE